MQVIDFQDVTFHPLSTNRVVCTGAKPAATSVPDNLLALAFKVLLEIYFLVSFSI